MNKKELESYKSKRAEIVELRQKLIEMADGKSMIDHDIIIDYSTGKPRAQAIVGVDWKRVLLAEGRYKNRIKGLEEECHEIENWVENIQDSITRRLFRLWVIDGKSQKDIGRSLNFDRSSVSKKIDTYLKDSHNSHNSQV